MAEKNRRGQDPANRALNDPGYHYDSFRLSHFDGGWDHFWENIRIGSPPPDFAADTLDGRTVKLSDYFGKPILLQTGSISCTMYAQGIGAMNRLRLDHPDVTFIVLYGREAHPGERIPKLESMSDKIERARRLKAALNENRILLLDDMSGSGHRLYGALPSSAVLIDAAGNVVFRSTWANPKVLGKAIRRLLEDAPLDRIKPRFPRPKTGISLRIFMMAGWKSLGDFVREFPKVFVHHWKNDWWGRAASKADSRRKEPRQA